MEIDRHLVTRFDRIRPPTQRRIGIDGLHLERPHDGLALVFDQHMNPDMRIGPFELFDRSVHGDVLVAIEHGEGMMRKRRRGYGNRHSGKNESLHGHGSFSGLWSLQSNYFAGAGRFADEPRRLPSGSVAATNSPPREPSFKG